MGGYDTDMTHAFQAAPYRALGDTVLGRQLGKGLLALDILCLESLVIQADAADKLTSAGLASVQLPA